MKVTALSAYIRKIESFKNRDLKFHHKELEKEEQSKPKVTKRKGIIEIRTETKYVVEKINRLLSLTIEPRQLK